MSTLLYIVSNIKVSLEKVLTRKDWFVEQLNQNYYYAPIFTGFDIELEKINNNDWGYELPMTWCFETDKAIPDTDIPDHIIFESPSSSFYIIAYNESLVLATGYKLSQLYYDSTFDDFVEIPFDYEDFNQKVANFRKSIYSVLSIFGGTEIIYLSDGSCGRLFNYLTKIEEGESYQKVKKQMFAEGLPIVRDYSLLNTKGLDYKDVKEYVFDDFDGIK